MCNSTRPEPFIRFREKEIRVHRQSLEELFLMREKVRLSLPLLEESLHLYKESTKTLGTPIRNVTSTRFPF
jgi:hypothetical protein